MAILEQIGQHFGGIYKTQRDMDAAKLSLETNTSVAEIAKTDENRDEAKSDLDDALEATKEAVMSAVDADAQAVAAKVDEIRNLVTENDIIDTFPELTADMNGASADVSKKIKEIQKHFEGKTAQAYADLGLNTTFLSAMADYEGNLTDEEALYGEMIQDGMAIVKQAKSA